MLVGMRRTLAALVMLVALGTASPAGAEEAPRVRGVLFFSPQCGHCHVVIDEHLPAVFDAFGGEPGLFYDLSGAPVAFYLLTNGTVELLLVDIDRPDGWRLYEASTAALGVPDGMRGVPRMVVGTEFFVGSVDIPRALPGLVESGLSAGGIAWPEIPGIDAALAAVPTPEGAEPDGDDPVPTTEAAATTTTAAAAAEEPPPTPPGPFEDLATVDGLVGLPEGAPPQTVGEKFRNDPVGNTVAVVVLAGMLASLAAVVVLGRRGRLGGGPDWVVPILALAGILVAFYLAYVETSDSVAVCGPVGDCNAVQQSKFALLFGVIPVGVVGLAGYAVVVGAWLGVVLGSGVWRHRARVALAAGSVVGVGFSIYLTFLEPFVIGATCMWCIASALIVTGLLWVTAGPGLEAWRRLRRG